MRDRGHNTAIVTAGGRGKRMPGAVKKQFRLLAGKPVLIHALSHFVVNELISRVIVTLPQEDICQTKEMLRHYFTADMQKIILVEGGKERQDSVYQGLLACPIDTEMVLIQDGVRPFVGLGMIEKLLQAAREMGAAIPAAPVKHTIKQVEGMQIIHTLPRESLVQVYTPQVYDYKLLLSCYHQAMAQGLNVLRCKNLAMTWSQADSIPNSSILRELPSHSQSEFIV